MVSTDSADRASGFDLVADSGFCFTNCRCCGCGLYSRGQATTIEVTGPARIDTSPWRKAAAGAWQLAYR